MACLRRCGQKSLAEGRKRERRERKGGLAETQHDTTVQEEEEDSSMCCCCCPNLFVATTCHVVTDSKSDPDARPRVWLTCCEAPELPRYVMSSFAYRICGEHTRHNQSRFSTCVPEHLRSVLHTFIRALKQNFVDRSRQHTASST